MLAEKLADVTVLPDQQNISTPDRLAGIKRVRVHRVLSGNFGKSSVPKAKVFEPETSALSLVKDPIGINYHPTPEPRS
jgi:hypothetical protein